MKKILFSVFAFVAVLLLSSCGNGSSGTTMLDLDVRIMPDKEDTRMNDPDHRQEVETLCNLFTVLPGPYEFIWEELKNQDGRTGYEQCATKLKIKLRLNKTLKPGLDYHYADKRMMNEEAMIKAISDSYAFHMFNSEGKTFRELSDENSDQLGLIIDPELNNLWGADGKIGYKKNTDGLLDFYHFLTSKPGTEYTLTLDCQIHLCKEIEDIIAYNKGLYIEIIPAAMSYDWRFE